MAIKAVSGFDNIDRYKWDSFVKSHPYGNAFQLPVMNRVFLSARNYEPYVAACTNEDGNVKGIMQGVRICNGQGFMCTMTSRVIVWGGPLAENNDPQIVSMLLDTFNSLVKNDCVYCEIRNLEAPASEQKELFESAGFEYFAHLNILVNVQRDEDEILNDFKPAKRRNVKKALKEHLEFGEVETIEELREAYGILNEVYKKTEVPLSDVSLFESLFEQKDSENFCRFYKVSSNGNLAGVMVTLVNNNGLYEWYVACKEDLFAKRPNEFLVWNVILEARKQGLKFFDFGGAGKPDEKYGVRDFKKGFGGKVVETGRFRRVYRKLPWLLGNAAIKMKKHLK